ncbi:hypothetical protein P22_1729 [Propionispora sp. 2/2-37]|uniref:YaaL family protein n=1 Tax=Propionispora sp. 2/2-37 TaxID=1677858 RepID=UPI0006BB6A39|nr:YaaL family protein [Propionispora sp. 2/2-37]CUH95655.1 hypothetical protein P22_1729 [Propionispora sp. 2/2-37]
MGLWRRFFLGWLFEERHGLALPGLPELVEQARKEWLYAQQYFNNVNEPDLVEYAIYLIKASEKKYNYLLKQAKKEGIKDSLHLEDANKCMTDG